MSNVGKYLANAQRMANESFNNADGFIDDDLSFTGDDFFNNAEVLLPLKHRSLISLL
jgi:hypothetical protein